MPGILALMWAMTSLSKQFKVDRGDCDRAIVIWTFYLVFLGHWDDGGLLEAGGDYSMGPGQVEDFREDT